MAEPLGVGQAPAPRLLDEHQRLLAASAITSDVASARGYLTVLAGKELEPLGFAPYQRRVPGLLIPIRTVTGDVGTYQFRPDTPRPHKNGRAIKYETPAGSRLVLDVPPSIRPALGDPARDLWITEGSKKADAAVSMGLVCIALLGVWGWRGRNAAGGKAALPDWDSIALNGRKVFIAFDSDVMTNPKVQAALDRLAGFLRSRGAVVHRVTLPPGPDGGKVGLDDYFADGKTVEDALSHARVEAQAPAASAAATPMPRTPYFEQDGTLWWNKPTRDGPPVAVCLANFTARIVAQVIHDDGAERHTALELEGVLDGIAVRFSVSGAQFAAMSWPIEHLGARAILSPGFGLKDHARVAIQSLSGRPAQRVVYKHTGWRQVGDAWIYLHAGGAVGAHGTVDDVLVDLPGQLALLRLPDPPTGDRLQAAIRASLSLLDLTGGEAAGDQVMVPAMGLLYRSVLGPCDLSAHFSGETGAFKTEILARLMQHFGPGLDRLHLPSWTSTGNALEGLAFFAKDAALAVDDFVPQGTAQERARLYQLADRIFRGVGNRAGRSRMKPDGTPRPDRTPRCVVFSTGEDVPVGKSCLARVLIIEVPKQLRDRPRVPGAVRLDRLAKAQQQGEQGLFAQAMAGYLRWIAARYPALEVGNRATFTAARDQALSLGTHARDPEKVAHIHVGWKAFLEYAAKAGAVTSGEAERLLERVWSAMTQVVAAQEVHQRSNDVVERFLTLLASAIGSGAACVADAQGRAPQGHERRWGWAERHGGAPGAGADWAARTLLVGWVDGDDLYLEPDAAIKAANGMAQGTEHIPGPESLGRRLREREVLLTSDKDRGNRTRVRRTLGGARRDVWHMAATRVVPSEECPPCPTWPKPAEIAPSGPDNGTSSWDTGSPAAVPVPPHVSQPPAVSNTESAAGGACGDSRDTRDTDPEGGAGGSADGGALGRQLDARNGDANVVATLKADIGFALRRGDDELRWKHQRIALEGLVGFAAASEAIEGMRRRLDGEAHAA